MRNNRQIIGVIGVGAFGEFMLKYLIPYFDVRLYDSHRDLAPVGKIYNAEVTSLERVCESDIVVLAVPVAHMREAVAAIKDKLKKRAGGH